MQDIQKAKQNKIKNLPKQLFLSDLVIKYILLFSHEDFMINQHTLMFLKKNTACELDFQPNAQSVISTIGEAVTIFWI